LGLLKSQPLGFETEKRTKDIRVSEGVAPRVLNFDARWRRDVKLHAAAAFTPWVRAPTTHWRLSGHQSRSGSSGEEKNPYTD